MEQQEKVGKEQLIAIHGNRFVLHIVFHKLRSEGPGEFINEAHKAAEVKRLVVESLAATISNVLQHFPTAYPANLFKNASKCRDLKSMVISSRLRNEQLAS